MGSVAGSATGARMGFVGVSTSGSSIMTVFPRWADALGLPTRHLVGHDLPLGAPARAYRNLVRLIRDDDSYLGALVTTHKIDLYRHAAAEFDELDDFARLCGEISLIAKRDGRLLGQARDPISAGLALEEFLPPDHFATTDAAVVCLGAGGAGTAATWYLGQRADRPSRIVCTDADEGRLAHLAEVHQAGGLDRDRISYIRVAGPADGDAVVADAPAGSLVINATGLGKDRPGSPVSDAVAFPPRGVVWELNYRGALDFLRQARSQADAQELTVVDGWDYFVHGWSQAISGVFGVDLDPATVAELSRLAAQSR